MSFSIAIPSKDPRNCTASVMAIYRNESELPRDRILIIDDGAKQGAYANCPNVTWLDGRKPFIYAANMNIALRHAFDVQGVDGVVLLNDDAQLETRRGFTALHEAAMKRPEYGIISAVTNSVGNLNQTLKKTPLVVRPEVRMLCFVAVHISRACWEKVGELDERYCIDHGVEDGDYSYRTLQAGLKLGVFDGCFVDHKKLPSTGRSGGNGGFRENAKLFEEKGFSYGDHG